jgi:hypothetical protein
MQHLSCVTIFSESDLKANPNEIQQQYIEYTVIPSICLQLESYLKRLNNQNIFPVTKIKKEKAEDWEFDFIFLTPNELDNIKSQERFKERMGLNNGIERCSQ